MSNIIFTGRDGFSVGTLPDGTKFMIDNEDVAKIEGASFYLCGKICRQLYLTDCNGRSLHDYIMPHKKGYEIDHINMNTLDNRKSNLRYCTHQQNQINQGLQCNNTSGAAGVRFYKPRNKYQCRIKVSQQEIHLGYYSTFTEAAQARNEAMRLMFGEYGRYNDVPPASKEIKIKVYNQCKRFANLSVCGAFFN